MTHTTQHLDRAAQFIKAAQRDPHPGGQLAHILSARAQLAQALDLLTFNPASLTPTMLTQHAARDLGTAASLTRTAASLSDPGTARVLELNAQLVTKRAQVLDELNREQART